MSRIDGHFAFVGKAIDLTTEDSEGTEESPWGRCSIYGKRMGAGEWLSLAFFWPHSPAN